MLPRPLNSSVRAEASGGCNNREPATQLFKAASCVAAAQGTVVVMKAFSTEANQMPVREVDLQPSRHLHTPPSPTSRQLPPSRRKEPALMVF